jgi:hypothetical protein
VRSNFLAPLKEHFLAKPEAEIFELLYQHDPRLYFSSLVQLAKVLKVQDENGPVGAFAREEALRKLEERAGADARKLFEAFLRKVDKLEAAGMIGGPKEAESVERIDPVR